MSKRVARLIPFYEYQDNEIFGVDGAPESLQQQRRTAFYKLSHFFQENCPQSLIKSEEMKGQVSDVDFTQYYRVPFQFRNFVARELKIGVMANASRGTQISDLDGNWSHDLTGAYGVNLYGYDFYKDCIDDGIRMTRGLGPVLGPYHAVMIENVQRLKKISGMDEVSFHMSGTEAVMQAVRLAHYHTKRAKTVVFCGAYHGWWDGVQPGIGNPRRVSDVYTLKENCEDTLRVLRTRKDIACAWFEKGDAFIFLSVIAKKYFVRFRP